MSRSVKVTVAGQKLSVRTAAKPKYVKELAAYVSGKLDEIKGSRRTGSTQSAALLAAMNIADELFQLREQDVALRRQVRERTRRIVRQLDEQLELDAQLSAKQAKPALTPKLGAEA